MGAGEGTAQIEAGSDVLIRGDGLVLTIGYPIVEAESVGLSLIVGSNAGWLRLACARPWGGMQ
jgi:hypothetical protein